MPDKRGEDHLQNPATTQPENSGKMKVTAKHGHLYYGR